MLVDDVLERIFGMLNVKDLLALMLTGKVAKTSVDRYVAHFVGTNCRLQRLQDVLNSITMPLLLSEKALKVKLEELGWSNPTLIHLMVIM